MSGRACQWAGQTAAAWHMSRRQRRTDVASAEWVQDSEAQGETMVTSFHCDVIPPEPCNRWPSSALKAACRGKGGLRCRKVWGGATVCTVGVWFFSFFFEKLHRDDLWKAHLHALYISTCASTANTATNGSYWSRIRGSGHMLVRSMRGICTVKCNWRFV